RCGFGVKPVSNYSSTEKLCVSFIISRFEVNRNKPSSLSKPVSTAEEQKTNSR
ncbi:unnamed protein product, partial [Brassica oleracea]